MPREAAAQVAIEAAVQSDYRLRGYSVSEGNPAASLSLGYDDPSGFYMGALAAGFVADGDPQLLLVEAHAGYAARVTPDLSLDVGLSRSEYFSGFGTSRNYRYTELYLGAALPNVATRISYSPDYFFPDTPTLYWQVSGGIEPARDWFLSAHAGALVYLDEPPDYLERTRYDWRLGLSRQLGDLGLHAEVSGRIEAEESGNQGDGAALVLTATYAF